MDNPRLPLFVAIGSAALAILLVFFLVLPKMGQVSTAKEDLSAAKSDGQSLLTQKNALEDTKAEAPQNRQIIDNVQEKIPPTADEPGLLLLLDKAALDAGLDLPTFSPSAPVFDDTLGLSVISVSMSAVGTYSDVTQFTYKIETFPRAAKITSLTLTPGGTVDAFGDQLLTVNIDLEAFTSDTSAGPGSAPGPTEAGA